MTPCEIIKTHHALKTALKWCEQLKQDDKFNEDIFFNGVCDYLKDFQQIIERDYNDRGIERKP